MFRGVFLMLARFAVCSWVGAAALFVVTSVSEQKSPEFDLGTKSMLALIRFPSYYLFGFALLGCGLVFGLLARGHQAAGRWRNIAYSVLLVVSLGMMLGDYLAIYQPLHDMMAAEGGYDPARFEQYHVYSKYINMAGVSLSCVAALLLCWPGFFSGKR